jgi:hypothetical protein
MKEKINCIDMVIDSGSDITLISENYLKKMDIAPKPKTGQKINLIQLTSATAIIGYVNVPIYFETLEGFVRMDVEAYVVKGMTTPIILGNDFADQFDLSLLRQDGQTRLPLGESNRSVSVANSTSPFIDEQGKIFRVHTVPEANSKCFRVIAHKRNKRLKRKHQRQSSDPYIQSFQSVHIPPETIKKVRVSTTNLEGKDFHYAEKLLNYHHQVEDCYGPPDSIITTKDPFLAITNFSKQEITVPAGQILAIKRNPSVWLNTYDNTKPAIKENLQKRACLIQTLVKTLGKGEPTSEDLIGKSEPLEGGPKTAEPPPPLPKKLFPFRNRYFFSTQFRSD